MVEGIADVFFIPPVLPGRFWFAAAFSKGVQVCLPVLWAVPAVWLVLVRTD